MKGIQKPVLLIALLNLCALVDGGGGGEEGSGQQFSKMEQHNIDLDDDDFDDFEEGSADDLNMLEQIDSLTTVDRDDGDYDLSFTNIEKELENLEYYDYLEEYDDNEYAYMDTSTSADSILNMEEITHNDIEIRLKPDTEEAEEILLETSQIFIMVGSAFVSFAIFMLSFFLCRRMIVRKQKKQIPFSLAPDRRSLKESSIVKDYEKVPTTTKQFMQQPHIEMYRDKPSSAAGADYQASKPLVS